MALLPMLGDGEAPVYEVERVYAWFAASAAICRTSTPHARRRDLRFRMTPKLTLRAHVY